MTSNRRRFSRIPFRTTAHIQVPDGKFAVEVIDLSLKGALVHSDSPLPVTIGAQASLAISLDDADVVIAMAGTLVHQEDDCYGLVCREIDLDSATHLRRLLELNLGDESILDRELSALIADL